MKSTPTLVCNRCQLSDRLSINPGKGPHYRSLRCDRCSSFVKWLSKSSYQSAKAEGIGEPIQASLLGGEL